MLRFEWEPWSLLLTVTGQLQLLVSASENWDKRIKQPSIMSSVMHKERSPVGVNAFVFPSVV